MTEIQSDILAQLERIVEEATPRRGQSVHLCQSTAEARSKAALDKMRSTILPRFVQISNEQEDSVTLSVNNGRLADMTEAVMDGELATSPDATADRVAQMLNMVCSGTGVQFLSTPPEHQDDIAETGMQMSKIDDAISKLEPVTPPPAQAEPAAPVAIEPEAEIPAAEVAKTKPENPTSADDAIGDSFAAKFFANAKKVSEQRILVSREDSTVAGPDGVLTQNLDVVQQLMDDLSTWEADSDLGDSGPQLIILRGHGQDMPSLTICRDSDATVMAAHHTRRLGSIIQIWKSLTTHENFS